MDTTRLPFTENIKHWLAHGERGTSSETIVSLATGVAICPRSDFTPPADPDDLRRCAELLKACPELRPYLNAIPNESPVYRDVWKRLVPQWDELVELMEKRDPRCWHRMQKAWFPKERPKQGPRVTMRRAGT